MEADVSLPPDVITEDQARTAYSNRLCTIEILKKICQENNIVLTGSKKTKADLIEMMIDHMKVNNMPFPLPDVSQPRSSKRKPPPGAVQAQGRDSSDDDDEAEEGTPTTAKSEELVRQFAKRGQPWFNDDFLTAALHYRLDRSKDFAPEENTKPTLFILVGPASVGKSSAKDLIIKNKHYVVNVDVDEIKLYGNDVLPQHPNPKKPGEMLSDVEGIQFKYNLVLQALRRKVFELATHHGSGQYKNIILDTTGAMRDEIKMYIRMAKPLGYTVTVIIVYSEKKQCLQRVKIRNRELCSRGERTRYIPTHVVSSMYDTFLKKNRAGFYALDTGMLELTDELILVDNHSAQAKIVATRTRDSLQIVRAVAGEDSIVDVNGAFYGLTLIPSDGSRPASIVQGDLQSQIEKAQSEWDIFDRAEKLERAKREEAKAAIGMGGSRKRRISTRRLRGTRVRKTVKKYSRPHTRRRRRHHRRHS